MTTKVSVSASCGCGFYIIGPAKNVLVQALDHSTTKFHNVTISGDIHTDKPKRPILRPQYQNPPRNPTQTWRN